MTKLNKHTTFISGTPKFRIRERTDDNAPTYLFYGQSDLFDDLTDTDSNNTAKRIKTFDEVSTLQTGDVVFSLISGNASIVRERHAGYLYTQNYVKLVRNQSVDPRFLVYLLNEHRNIRKQFASGLQGSSVIKYTVKQLKELEVPKLPNLDKQKIIGDIYFKQLRLQALRKRTADFETTIMMRKLDERIGNERTSI